jgi:hypothetical protein
LETGALPIELHSYASEIRHFAPLASDRTVNIQQAWHHFGTIGGKGEEKGPTLAPFRSGF